MTYYELINQLRKLKGVELQYFQKSLDKTAVFRLGIAGTWLLDFSLSSSRVGEGINSFMNVLEEEVPQGVWEKLRIIGKETGVIHDFIYMLNRQKGDAE